MPHSGNLIGKSALQLVLFDVGPSGNEGPVRKAEFADLMSKAVNAPGGKAAAGLT